MSSSLGRIALGIVGALILAPFGLAAVGFAIGSAVGGFLFAPEGPNVEGPRLGDTDVTASTVGKIIPECYGVTRMSGNVFWSGGLKEIKTEEEQGGGGKGGGGGGGTVTTYSYFASFAIAFAKGPARRLLRIWADGKLVYDTGVRAFGTVQDATAAITEAKQKSSKYNVRFREGVDDVETQGGFIDPLVQESINRRLAGLPDVNAGSGPQTEYTTMAQLIAQYQAAGDDRSALYATYLQTLKTEAEAAGGTPPNYQFTPSYKEIAYLVFPDMPLEDFGNRIPNITAEIVWKTDITVDPNDTLSEHPVAESATDQSIPNAIMAVDIASRSACCVSGAGTEVRRWSLSSASESTFRSSTYQIENVGNSIWGLPAPTTITNVTILDVLCADARGDWIAIGTKEGNDGNNKLYKLDNASLTIKDSDNKDVNTTINTATFATNAGLNGTLSLVAYNNPSGDFGVVNTGTPSLNALHTQAGIGLGEGPIVYGGGTPGSTTLYWASQNGTSFRLHKIGMRFSRMTSTPVFDGDRDGDVVDPDNLTTVTRVTSSFTTMGTYALGGGALSACIHNPTTNRVYVFKTNSGGGGTVYEFNPNGDGSAGNPYLLATRTLQVTPPGMKSGFSRSGISAEGIGYFNGNDAYEIDPTTGEDYVYVDALSGNVSTNIMMFEPNSGAGWTWLDGEPTIIRFGRLSSGLFGNDISEVVADICKRVGFEDDEYDIQDINGFQNIKGYTIARPSNGRKVLEKLFQAYFVDGVESDWTIKFKPQDTTPVRIITENELGKVESPTGDVPFAESRVPEQDLPAEVALIFADVDRDYQQGAAHYRRVSQPTPSMYSRKIENVELPLVMNAQEGRSAAERVLFLLWMARDTGKTRFGWTHIDLDPSDVVQFQFNNGRTLTDRITKMSVGANFEIEAETIRSADPVFAKTETSSVNTSSVPQNSILIPAFARMFVLDMPLLYDYHDAGRTATRYYTAVGSDVDTFTSADLFQSIDGVSYAGFDVANSDVTWGTITSGRLPSPRSLHSIDYDNTFTVQLSVDNGNLSSITLDELATGVQNLGLIYNPQSGNVEILQFQNVTANVDGTYTFDTLVRGRRGTDYATQTHQEGEFFLYVTDADVLPQINDLSAVGTTRYYKAVARGSLVATAPSIGEYVEGRDLYPYSPNYVRREDDATDLTVKWNRRTRVGGAWNMSGTGIEDVPLNEDLEQYETYLLPITVTGLENFDPLDADSYELVRRTNVPEVVFTGTELATAGYTLADDINVAVYQLSAQVGRGFGRVVALAP